MRVPLPALGLTVAGDRRGDNGGQRHGVVLVFALTCGIAEAVETDPGFVNGNDLYAYCTASDNSKRGICLGYVEGMADSIGLMQTASAAAVFCIPPVLASQARDVVVKYLQDNPAHRHEAGATLVMEALHDAWPCR
jgi:hypothetical protein